LNRGESRRSDALAETADGNEAGLPQSALEFGWRVLANVPLIWRAHQIRSLPNRGRDNDSPIRSYDSPQLPEERKVIINMLNRLERDGEIERRILERQVR